MCRRDLAVALLLWPLAALGASHQAVPAADDYRQILDQYRVAPRAATARLESWTPAQIDAAVDRVVDDESAWPWRDVRLAAMLHTDRWFACEVAACADSGLAHVHAAERLVDRVVSLERRQRYYAERWYRTAAALLNRYGHDAEHAALMGRFREKLPAGPSIAGALKAFTTGQALEYAASVGRTWSAAPPGRLLDPGSAWARAATAYRAALRHAPDFYAASLRLGRMRMLQHVPDEAAGHFVHAAKAEDPRIVYLATLFLGALAERDEQFDAAARRYRDAMIIYPSGQAAWVALAQLLSRTGREAESRQVMSTLLRERRGTTVDPLWGYLPPPRPDLADIAIALDELRAEAVQ